MRDSRHRRNRPGVSSQGGSGDSHYTNEGSFIRMREYCRSMVRDDGVTKFLINRAVNNIVRTGFRYEPDTGDKGVDRELKDRHWEWAKDPLLCDAAGIHSFPQQEK